MKDRVDIKDIDLDIVNHANKEFDENDSILYIRTRKNKSGGLDCVDVVWGDLYDLVEGLLQQKDSEEIVLMAAALHISKGADIDKYLKEIKG